MSGAHDISATTEPAVGGPTLAWALKRAALGFAILLVTVTTAACLLYAGIEPDRADAGPQIARQGAIGSATTGSLPGKH